MKFCFTLFLAFMLFTNNQGIRAQQFNTFESEYEMPIILDTLNPNNVWQIGEPDKMIFSEANSLPYALVTDTLNPYPANSHSSFMFKINMSTLWSGWPFFILEWDQKMDCEVDRDGGIIEVSYDSLQTWVNFFDDTLYQPMSSANLNEQTLFNNESGISQQDTEWKHISLCWSSDYGDPVDEIFIRFSFLSDSVETFQEGWMLDNFEAFSSMIDGVEDFNKGNWDKLNVDIYPQPATHEISIKVNEETRDASLIEIYDISGNSCFKQKISFNNKKAIIDIEALEPGMHIILLKDVQGRITALNKFVKLDAKN